jgi:hypothetical protein
MIVKAIGGHVNYILLKALKSVSPYMGSGSTNSQLESKFTEAINRIPNPITIAADGSSHDSH